MSSARLCAAAIAAALFCASAVVHADSAASAEALFRDGRRLLLEGKLEEACPKLEESQRLDPSSGTLLNLALCHERQGRLATAWAEYTTAAGLARVQKRPERARTAAARAAELEPRLPKVTIIVSSPVEGLLIRRDDEEIGEAAKGSALPTDPGHHVIEARAPGHRPWRLEIEATEGEHLEVTVPELEPEPAPTPIPEAAPPTTPPPSTEPPAEPSTKLTAPTPTKDRGAQPSDSNLAGWSLLGGGVVAIGVGTYFGVRSLDAYSQAEQACPYHRGCGATAISQASAADRDAWVANIALPLGVLATSIGVYLLLGTTTESSSALHLTPSERGATLDWGARF